MNNRKSNYLFNTFLALSVFSFIYLNFIGVGDTSDFSFSSITTYENVTGSSFVEVKAISAFFERVIDIIMLR